MLETKAVSVYSQRGKLCLKWTVLVIIKDAFTLFCNPNSKKVGTENANKNENKWLVNCIHPVLYWNHYNIALFDDLPCKCNSDFKDIYSI